MLQTKVSGIFVSARSSAALACFRGETSSLRFRAIGQIRLLSLRARRNKPKFQRIPEVEPYVRVPDAYFMETPFNLGKGNLEEYLEKASLSPWAPLPESAYRKYFDLAVVEPGDVHVDLGCGDGRVNFHATDYAGVERSVGIDVDDDILQFARNRLAKRHPPPKNLEFHIADLMDESHEIWEKVQEATIITMFFAQKALRKFRPVLERKLIGRRCRIITAGYGMPDWNPHTTEVVLGTQLHLYKWGYDEEDGSPLFIEESMLDSVPDDLIPDPIATNERFKDYNIVDHPHDSLSPAEEMQRFREECEADDAEDDEDETQQDEAPDSQENLDSITIPEFWKP